MAELQIEVRDDPGRHRYEVFVDDELAGFTAYRSAPGRLVFVHTEVADRYEGHGVGSALVRAELDDARRRGLRVTPQCPFVAAYIRRHPEYLELVDDDDRIWVTGGPPGARAAGSPSGSLPRGGDG